MHTALRPLLGLGIVTGTLAAADAEAHFRLVFPPTWTTENVLGDPQKSMPCGGEQGTPTGAVTRFRPGQTITVQWQETIYHPGHWRIAFAENRGDLIEPMVTVDANQNAVSATIVDPPVAPIIADNLFPRIGNGATQAFQFDVTLPNRTCAHCTLQILQFMLGHGPPNYIYHHCADIELANDPGDAGTAADAIVVMDTGTPAVDSGGGQPFIPDAAAGVDAASLADTGGAPPPPNDSGIGTGGRDATANADAAEPLPIDGLSACGCKTAEGRGAGGYGMLGLLLFAAVIMRAGPRAGRGSPRPVPRAVVPAEYGCDRPIRRKADASFNAPPHKTEDGPR